MGALILGLRAFHPSALEGTGFSKEVRAQDGQLLRLTLSPDQQYRIFRPLQSIHWELREAVILLEDQYFYYHPGVNPLSLLRGAFSLGTDRKIGGSTITMQMVRLKHKLRTRHVVGKFIQIAYAFWYELLFSKDEILEAYLNLTPYGGNIEGAEAASRIYFDKSSEKLSLLESLTLAVIPQNPLKRSLNRDDLQLVERARQRLVEKWLEKFPSDREVLTHADFPVLSSRIKDLPFEAPHFVEEVIRRNPTKHLISTSLDLGLQKKIEQQLKRYLLSVRPKGVHNGAVLLVEAATREVRTWVGSGDFFDSNIQGQIDGIGVRRSPGSTLKPFIYGRALDEGLIHPGSMLKDTPSSFGIFDPENFDRKFLGPMSATQALVQSRNVPAISLNSQISPGFLYQMLKNVGVAELRSEKFYGLGTAIGTAEMTPLDLAALYAALYNRGEWQPLRLAQEKQGPKPFRILSPESSYLVLDMLTQSPREQDSLLNDQLKSRFPVAWKTGTSYGFRDAWTVGVFGPYVLVVWLGNFDYSENPHLLGRDMASPLFFQIAELFSRSIRSENLVWRNPFGLNLKKVEVCDISGALPGESCPHLSKENFIPSVSPIETCSLHRKILVSKRTGLRLCGQPKSGFAVQVFEFWPSDILELFQKFGLKRKLPPSYEPECAQRSFADLGRSPEIMSPKKDLKYLISYAKSHMAERIPLRAVTDADVRELSWFVNRELVARTSVEQTVFFEAGPGTFEVMVVDDQGRMASRDIDVIMTK